MEGNVEDENDAIPTCKNLFRRHCHKDGAFPSCFKEPETIEHLLFRCPTTIKIWKEVNDFTIYPPNTEVSLINWINSARSNLENFEAKVLCLGKFFLTCWWVWKSRNKWVFDQSRKAARFWRSDIIRDWVNAGAYAVLLFTMAFSSMELLLDAQLHQPVKSEFWQLGLQLFWQQCILSLVLGLASIVKR